jgi:hypothetical protein
MMRENLSSQIRYARIKICDISDINEELENKTGGNLAMGLVVMNKNDFQMGVVGWDYLG